MSWRAPREPLNVSVRVLMLAVAVLAISIRWSAHWFDCKQQAVLHASLAEDQRVFADAAGIADWARNRQARQAEWHDEMRRRYERAAWQPWSFPPSEPPHP